MNGEAALSTFTPRSNFGAGSSERTVVERLPDAERARHTPTLAIAFSHASEIGASTVIVLGCGDGRALIPLLGASSGPLVQGCDAWCHVDIARAEQENGHWFGVDFDVPADVAALEQLLASPDGPHVMVVQVLEELRDPRPLFRLAKRWLARRPGSAVVFGGEERESPAVGERPPLPRPHHVREWSLEEAVATVEASGLEVLRSLRTPDGVRNTWTVIATATRLGMDAWMLRAGLPSTATEALILSSEHGLCRVTGGIGAYVEEKIALSQGRLALGLLQPVSQLLPGAEGQQWLLPERLGVADQALSPAEQALILLEQALLFLPELRHVECQDYLGLGGRIVQAKRAGLLPRSLEVEVVAHGSHVYLERAFSRWSAKSALSVHNDERTALEDADRVTFGTRYLRDLYSEAGYRIDPEKIRLLRYPFLGFRGIDPAPVDRADTLLYFGKRTAMKGFPLFVAAVELLLADPSVAGALRRVVLIGPPDPSTKDENDQLRRLLRGRELIESSLPRAEARAQLQRLAPVAICVLPYRGDNHPVSVLEVMASGCQLVACDAGGIPELVPAEGQDDVLFTPEAAALADSLSDWLRADPEARTASVQRTFRAAAQEQEQVNAELLEEMDHPLVQPARGRGREVGTMSVLVPCYESDLDQLRELVFSLNQQTRPPDQVIFVDDGSRGDFAPRLQEMLERTLEPPFKLLRHGVNRGLAAARNTALSVAETTYVANLDSDDLARNDFVRLYAYALDENPGWVGVTSYSDSFIDGEDWRFSEKVARHTYRPQGRGAALGLLDNCLGHANSAFRTAELRELGGWDASDGSMWEDWELYLRLAWTGKPLGVLTRSVTLYRVRDNSMARSYAQFNGQWRLPRSARGTFDVFEAYRLESLVRTLLGERNDLEKGLLGVESGTVPSVELPLRYRLADRLNRRVKALPFVHQLFKRSLRGLAE
jgi:glycosyltransferase involved in cell wall biosynthesis